MGIVTLLVACQFWLGLAHAGQGSGLGQIRVITPQWEGQTNADGTGLFFDILRAVYEPEGIGLSFVFAPWKRCQATVTSGGKDAMLCEWAVHARDRGQLIPKTPLYIEVTAAVVKKASGLDWRGMHAMDYKRAVWLRGYDYHQDPHMNGIQLADWHEADTHEEAWANLNRDRSDVYIDALIDISKYLETCPDPGLYAIYPLWKEKAYVAFADSARSKALIRIYDRQMQGLLASGRLAQIYKKWGQPFDPADWGL